MSDETQLVQHADVADAVGELCSELTIIELDDTTKERVFDLYGAAVESDPELPGTLFVVVDSIIEFLDELALEKISAGATIDELDVIGDIGAAIRRISDTYRAVLTAA